MIRPAPLAAALLLSLVLAGGAALLVGGAPGISALDAARTLAGRAPTGADARIVEALVFEVRLPRVLLLALAGAALAAAGVALQACLQNPLADPGLLGVSAGASLGAVVAYASGLAASSLHSVPLAAFAGALAAITLVVVLSHAAGRPTTGILLLTGVAVASLCSSVVSVILVSTGDHRVHEMVAWLLGSVEGRGWPHLRISVVPVLAGIGGIALAGRLVDALALGEEQAAGLGVDPFRGRALVLGLVALTAGAAVSVVGPVGFVGLMVPHMVRSVSSALSRTLVPASALAGALFLVVSDLITRVVSPLVDVPVGVVTALVGVPFFLALLHRARVR